ncbi:MAG TPA: hypothetical protein VMT52_05755, partial [Planctomycetota bacterium]|nr:hypothetical protein [Planctomycetota bacterium]
MGIDSADDGYVLQVRSATPGTTRRFGGPIDPSRGPLPAWLRLERQGAAFIGSYSNDGTTFVEYAREDVPALDVAGLLVGFSATSGQDNAPFDYCAVLDFGDEAPGDVFHRGDADDNGSLQLTDALRILGFLFLGGPPPTCLDAGDADDNGSLQLTDALRILGFLFLGGPPPEPPGPPADPCGVDPTTEDELDCASYLSC